MSTENTQRLDERLRAVVAALIEDGATAPDVHEVAEAMGTTVRTLQRRLHGTGLTYGGVVQQMRCAAARRLLRDPGRTIGQVARAVGYSDHAHFTRAFQRWTGLTPREFRLGRRADEPPPQNGG